MQTNVVIEKYRYYREYCIYFELVDVHITEKNDKNVMDLIVLDA